MPRHYDSDGNLKTMLLNLYPYPLHLVITEYCSFFLFCMLDNFPNFLDSKIILNINVERLVVS